MYYYGLEVVYGEFISHISILEIFVVFEFFRFSHLSIYGNNVINLALVNVRHVKCIIIEWEIVYKESTEHIELY